MTAAEGRRANCGLVQSVTDTEWFQDFVFGGADLVEKITIIRGPLTGTLLRLDAPRVTIFCHLLRGRVRFVNPLTGRIVGSGRTGSAVLAFRPR